MADLKTITELKALFETGDTPSQVNFEDFIEKASVFSGNEAIWTSRGKYYNIYGLTDTQKGDALRTALDECEAGEWIFLPPGAYYSATGFTIKQSTMGIIGLSGSSKSTRLYSDSSHALILDTSYSLYNVILKNFGVGQTSTGSDYDAIFIGPVDGPGVTQSQLELDLHIDQSDRDGIHIEGEILSGRAYLKTTGQVVSTAVDRYMVYAEKGTEGFNITVTNNEESKFYFTADATNYSVIMTAQSNRNNEFTDLNGSNNLFIPGKVETFPRKSLLQNMQIKLPVLGIPKSYITALYEMEDTSGEDLSGNGNDIVWSNSPTTRDSEFGKQIDLDGVDQYGTITANSELQGITGAFCMGFILRTDQDAANKRILYSGSDFDFKYTFSTGQLSFQININGGLRNVVVDNIEKDKDYVIVCYYDGIDNWNAVVNGVLYERNSVGAGSVESAVFDGNITIGQISSNPWDGTISRLIFVNKYYDWLPKEIEAHLALNLRFF
jgi:hypothetical protein